MSEELKPCPFCGSKNVKLYRAGTGLADRKVRCTVCRASSQPVFHTDSDRTTAAWNARSPDINTDLLEALEGLLNAAPAFRLRRVGGEGSPVRGQQEAHIAAEDRARTALSKARATQGGRDD